MTATRRGEGFGRSASDAALRGALLVAVAVIIGALLIWRGHSDNDSGATGVDTGTGSTTTRAGGGTTSRGGATTISPVTTPGVTAPIGSTRQPAQVRVLVANGSGIDGYASQSHGKLVTGGYASLGAENAKPGQDNTFIYYRDGYQDDARALAVFLGADGNVVQAMPNSLTDRLDQAVLNNAQTANIIIILGADRQVKVG
ncbi:MAG TPA: LytR C-terminal domain-containing protein [Acidimicrobiales bacterium]|nr:LytR C-terminal domain-containing protein [Acidimicrobiales bacterium]